MPTVLISGANRGLGLEFARQYAHDGWRVFAACRDPDSAKRLHSLETTAADRTSLHQLNVADAGSIDQLARTLAAESIDVLINNAGITEPRGAHPIGKIDYDIWERAFRINTIAPALMARAFLEPVARSQRKLIVTITSMLASIDINAPNKLLTPGDLTVYRTSKAAVNMVVRSLAADLKPRGISAVVISPGHVRTDMGGPNAPLSPEQSIAGMRKVIDTITLTKSGKFFFHDGSELPW